MDRTDWGLLSDALLRIERLEAQESGLLSFGLDNSCGIFVEKGRICWAAARGRARRLRDLLNEHAQVDVATLDAAFARCRAQGTPFGQSLVAEGLLRSDELELALRRHSAECLIELCHTSLPMRWTSNSGRGYAPRFTFRPADLWLDAVGYSFPKQRATALCELAALTGTDRHLVAFVLDVARDCVLPVATLGTPSVTELRLLAHFAATMPRVSLELAVSPAFTLASSEDGQSALVWWKEGVLFAELCQDREHLAVAMAQHLAGA